MPYISFTYKKLIAGLALLVLLVLPQYTHAQLLTSPESKTEETKFPTDSLNRRTPRGTVNGFIKAMADQNYIRASQFLQLKRSWRKNSQRLRIVQSFQRLLDQGGDMAPTALLSDKYEGNPDDVLEENSDLVGTIIIDDKEITLYVVNTALEGQPPLWQFSAETVAEISATTSDEDTLLNNILPNYLKNKKLGGVPIGHWIAVVVIVLVSYLIAWALVALMGLIIRATWKKTREEEEWLLVRAMGLPIRLCIALWLFVAVSQYAGISIIVRQRFSAITFVIGIVAFLILLWRLSDIVSDYTKNRMTLRNRISAISVILFLKRMAKAAIVIIGFITILGAIGLDVTTWFAALGIGGIALALGAQKTMENFVGSVTLIADQPIRVGDFCKVGEITGTVESIGMRSTRIRTNRRTVVTVPNGSFSSNNIENYAHRDRFLFDPVLEFRMETTPDQLRYLLVEIRTLLYSHTSINPEPAKVRFTGLTASAYKVEIMAYIEAVNLDASQEVQEDLLLRILDIVAQSGTDFAFPSQTLYMARDKGTDEDKTTATNDIVKQWREANELHLPSFTPEHIEKLKGSVKFPPEGSAVGREDGKTV
ncbi:mechanosensitive ion channel protein MscS [Flavobacterium rivuli WB 3.3-2 = DSM 21788]|uniref:Mechanosensitive ion channel protein MscS n=1 Tax=Flavobacterium rivuli WB 3.3-2 = DSM 21788 TaxID=1121895 RepID=A0A0A2M270_9FLAO|nr:mechanosensitive ion channel domain-containing protein [Flavobacterium rivuli]KGO86717.1 mechanosensitive ion channel protein MscS [Flavobacterium rivuli WB 3.3-2 = DSM 21788]